MKATKNATFGHATASTCRRLAGAIDIVRSVQECYLSRDEFDDHTTKTGVCNLPTHQLGTLIRLSFLAVMFCPLELLSITNPEMTLI